MENNSFILHTPGFTSKSVMFINTTFDDHGVLIALCAVLLDEYGKEICAFNECINTSRTWVGLDGRKINQSDYIAGFFLRWYKSKMKHVDEIIYSNRIQTQAIFDKLRKDERFRTMAPSFPLLIGYVQKHLSASEYNIATTPCGKYKFDVCESELYNYHGKYRYANMLEETRNIVYEYYLRTNDNFVSDPSSDEFGVIIKYIPNKRAHYINIKHFYTDTDGCLFYIIYSRNCNSDDIYQMLVYEKSDGSMGYCKNTEYSENDIYKWGLFDIDNPLEDISLAMELLWKHRYKCSGYSIHHTEDMLQVITIR